MDERKIISALHILFLLFLLSIIISRPSTSTLHFMIERVSIWRTSISRSKRLSVSPAWIIHYHCNRLLSIS